MLAKLPEQQRKSRTSDLNNNVNTKLAGLSVVLIIMLGVTGGYILLPLLPSAQPDIAMNLVNNNTTTLTPASATPSKVHSNSKIAKNKTTTNKNSVKINSTTPKTVKTNSASKANNT